MKSLISFGLSLLCLSAAQAYNRDFATVKCNVQSGPAQSNYEFEMEVGPAQNQFKSFGPFNGVSLKLSSPFTIAIPILRLDVENKSDNFTITRELNLGQTMLIYSWENKQSKFFFGCDVNWKR